jgi:phenylpyruvate tautomerase PptA (4-oxalocrotonate tautomerase family)
MAEMPYPQLDTPYSYPAEVKQRLARRLGKIYSRTMNSDINRLTVAIRELGEGGIWRCGEGDPRPAALLMCDIRRGRPAERRAELARRLVDACKEILGLGDDNLNVEFTQGRVVPNALRRPERRLESRRAGPPGPLSAHGPAPG